MTRTEHLVKLAENLCAMPVGAPVKLCCTGEWMFWLHRYEDGFMVLWASCVRTHLVKRCPPRPSPTDIGRFFRDPLDFVSFILGDPSYRFVLESPEIEE